MLRVVVETCDASMYLNTGKGNVDRSLKTFDIEAPQLEAFLRMFSDLTVEAQRYWHRRVIGIEVLPDNPQHGEVG